MTALTQARRDAELVRAFARRDLSIRYRSSALGWLWSLVQPMMTLIFFSVVFLVIFQVQAPPLGNGEGESYPAFLLCGLATWNVFSSLPRLSIDTLSSCASLAGKVSFPAWTPIIGAQLVQLLQVAMEFVVLIVLFLVLGNVGWTWLLAIPILSGLVMFSMGVGLMVAILYTRVGDVRELVTSVLTVLYFATPILYPMSMVEGASPLIASAISLNPMAWYVQAMHDVMYSLVAPAPGVLGLLMLGGAVTLIAGLVLFRRGSAEIAERL